MALYFNTLILCILDSPVMPHKSVRVVIALRTTGKLLAVYVMLVITDGKWQTPRVWAPPLAEDGGCRNY
jgi:hypothetical protein